jgi:hypothetical protein
MAPEGLSLKCYLGLEDSLQGWMGGSVHEEAFPSTNKVNTKVHEE